MRSYNYSDVGSTRSGVLGGDRVNMTNIDVRCWILVFRLEESMARKATCIHQVLGGPDLSIRVPVQ